MRVVPVPCLEDNYAYLVIADGGDAAIVDASEAAPVRDALKREGAKARVIWTTHHHWDHVGGNEELAKDLGLEVVAHRSDEARVPAMTHGVDTGDTVRVGDVEARCLHIPGHTLGAVAYFVDHGGQRVVFTGDTMFCAGCGRIFEGTPAMMHASLQRVLTLPGDTRVHCGHEYTAGNLRFAAHVEPSNAEVKRAQERAAKLRGEGKPTIGTTLDEERRVNPFLRVGEAELRKTLGIAVEADDAAAFGAVRAAKDSFK
ncbi:MAG TPA: hydroxyacylglutathione hydrolase [Polyangiaceae bacterium]|jgi:hydroxyacylglutathione hydrolase